MPPTKQSISGQKRFRSATESEEISSPSAKTATNANSSDNSENDATTSQVPSRQPQSHPIQLKLAETLVGRTITVGEDGDTTTRSLPASASVGVNFAARNLVPLQKQRKKQQIQARDESIKKAEVSGEATINTEHLQSTSSQSEQQERSRQQPHPESNADLSNNNDMSANQVQVLMSQIMQQQQQQQQAPSHLSVSTANPFQALMLAQLQEQQHHQQQNAAQQQSELPAQNVLLQMILNSQQQNATPQQQYLQQAPLNEILPAQQPVQGSAQGRQPKIISDTNPLNAVIHALLMSSMQSQNSTSVAQIQHLLQLQKQQQEEQQRQQQQSAQLAALLGLIMQQTQQQQKLDTNSPGQISALQQLLVAQASNTSSAPTPSLGNLPFAIIQALSSQHSQSGSVGPGASHQLAATTSGTLSDSSTSDQASLLQLLAATSNQMPRLPADQSTAVVTENSASSDGSSDRSFSNVLAAAAAASNALTGNNNHNGGDSSSSGSGNGGSVRPSSSGNGKHSSPGRPANAFDDREANGRARDLPALLVMPSDLVELSGHQTLLRYQIEVFRAGDEDISTHTRGRNKPVQRGQIGVRCRHCKVLPVSERLRGSVYFPRAVEGFYQAAQNMNSTHLQTGECPMMGDELRREFSDLIAARGSSTGAGRAYWAQQAKNLGLRNTDDGIRFYKDLGDL